jgi:hypothetical protein
VALEKRRGWPQTGNVLCGQLNYLNVRMFKKGIMDKRDLFFTHATTNQELQQTLSPRPSNSIYR